VIVQMKEQLQLVARHLSLRGQNLASLGGDGLHARFELHPDFFTGDGAGFISEPGEL
jgi:hypothetical protein